MTTWVCVKMGIAVYPEINGRKTSLVIPHSWTNSHHLTCSNPNFCCLNHLNPKSMKMLVTWSNPTPGRCVFAIFNTASVKAEEPKWKEALTARALRISRYDWTQVASRIWACLKIGYIYIYIYIKRTIYHPQWQFNIFSTEHDGIGF